MSNYILKIEPPKGIAGGANFSVSSSSKTIKNDAEGVYLNVPNPPYPASGNTVTFQLVKIHFEKAVFEPSTVTADIAVTAPEGSKDFVFDLSELAKCFIGNTVELTSTTSIKDLDPGKTEIGEDYFVSNAKPSISQERGCHVELEIHSRDFLLTTTRYSRSYLGRKLGEHIIKGTLAGGGVLEACNVAYDVDIKRLRNTTAKVVGKDTKELLQPYHIQYNEDFYTFISRIAARHGEYLYFENGKLTLGLDAETTAVPLDDKEKKDTKKTKFHVVREFEARSPMANPVAAEPFYKNHIYNDPGSGSDFFGTKGRYKVGNDAAGKPITVDPKKVYFNENAFDEYFDVFSTGSDSYPSSLMQQEPIGEIGITWFFTEFCPMIAEFTTRGTFFGGYALLRNVVLEMVRIQVAAAQKNNYWNKKYKEYINIDLPNKDEQVQGDKVNQFASFTNATNESNFMAAYYTAVREGEKAVAESTVKMKIVPGMVNVKVGSKVSYGGKEYFVTKVYGTMEVDASDTMYLEAVPVLKNEKGRIKMLPPYHKCYESAPVGPQTAVVADSNDPRFLNRVRLRYPWQSDSDPASPWVRVQTPFATENGGFSFLPHVGDEVMVNYIDGNPDRPYVSGFLFNNRNMPSFFPYYDEREIRHENGSRIVLGRGSAASFFNSVIPGAGFVTPFLGPQMYDLTKNISKNSAAGKMFGKVTLTDGYGMFEITGDTAKRQVYLNSAAGNITLDALTGITISAPLGDIKIRAKNIDIEAGNRINIVSGLNIKAAQDKKAAEERLARLQKSGGAQTGKVENAFKTVGDYASKLVAEALVGKIDYSIVRSVWEAICEPMDGTMKIKSYRYMQLEAGEGTAMDVDSGFHAVKADSMERFKLVDSLCSHVIMKTLANRLKEVKSAAERYKSMQEMLPEFWGGSVRDCNDLIADASAKLKTKSDHVFEAEYFCGMNEEQISEKCLQDDIEYEVIHRLEERTFIVLDGKFLVESIRKVAKILADPNDSKTYAEESKKLVSLGGEEKSDVITAAYASAVTSDAPLEEFINFYLESQDPVSMLKKYEKAWFRAAIYKSLCLEGDNRVLPANCDELDVLNDKDLIEIKDEKWNAIIKKIKDALPNLLDVDHDKDEGHKVIRDNFREVGKAFVRQIKTPKNIWSETQKGRILISDGDGRKTLKTKADHTGWESKENNAHLAEIRSFLLSR